MLPRTQAYTDAVVATIRRILPLALFDLVDPDIVYGMVTGSGSVRYANPDQLRNKVFTPGNRYITLERGRWRLNGTFTIAPNEPPEDEVGDVLLPLSGDDRAFPAGTFCQLNLDGLDILQAAAVYFSDRPEDGVARDFTLEVYSGDSMVYSETVTDNRNAAVYFEGFTAYNVTALRVVPLKWSKPGLRPRILEIVPGVFEMWDGDTITSVTVLLETAFDNLRTPYGICYLTINNKDLRFNPHAKNSIFLSITERQGIPVMFGVELPDRSVEYKRLGVFYQQEGGWETDATDIDITFKLVDIVGLIAKRKLTLPDALPETAEGWLALIVSHLGTNFADHYIIDDALAGLPLTASPEAVESMELGHLLRYICMAIGACFRADQETGYLRVSVLPMEGGSNIPLENMFIYPKESANAEVADISFKLSDGSTYVVAGTLSASGESLSIQNPFIHSQAQANGVARNILSVFSGLKYVTRDCGDMSREIGDLDVIQTVFNTEIAARRYKQEFSMPNGVLLDVPSYLVQATGGLNYRNRVEITESGEWMAPEGVSELRIILVPGGNAGDKGMSGTMDESGKGGSGGGGGKIYVATLTINDGQTFEVSIGSGGTLTQPAGATTFGVHSSTNGKQFPGGWGDAWSGNVYGATGPSGPAGSKSMIRGESGSPNTGNGGGGGSGGYRGVYAYIDGQLVIKSYPVPGDNGGSGGSGIAIIYYD